MTDETQFPFLCLSIAAGLEQVGGGSSLPVLWQLNTQIHCWERNSYLASPGVSSVTPVYAAWNSPLDTKPNYSSSAVGNALLFVLE